MTFSADDSRTDALSEEDTLAIIEDAVAPVVAANAGDEWIILLVDDDESLHTATRYALTGVRFHDKPLRILSAYSGVEAFKVVAETPDVALILLDVVMESDSAGLNLVRRVREELGNRMVQIILRTGQPGHAPERTVIVDYDINDYKSKTEFTSERIFTTVLSALRSFEQLRAIKRQQEAMLSFAHAAHRFVPREYLQLLNKEHIGDVQLGDQVALDMTVMFLDVRSFIALSENLSPQETLEFINKLLAWGSRIVRAHNGFIDKYLGDGALVLFPRCVDDALHAAIAIRQGARSDNALRRERGETPVQFGMGIHFGQMMIGIVGEAERLEATVIGDAVNSASRIQSMTKQHNVDLLISETAVANVRNREEFDVRLLDRTTLRGKTRELGLYELLDDTVPEPSLI